MFSALDAAAGAAGELARRLGRAVDDRRDLVEGHGEDVVQDEREPLGRRQRLEHDEQRQADRVRQQRLVLRVVPSARSTIGSGMRTPSGSSRRTLRERSMFSETRATTVVSQPPRFSICARVGAAQPQPGFLDGVVRLAQRAEHPVGHRPQAGSVLLESFRQPVALSPSVTFLRRIGS